MKSFEKNKDAAAGRKRRIARGAQGGAAGALAGGVIGTVAGPPCAVAGAILGGVAGAMAGVALDSASARQSARTRELDAQIGVSGGELGAPNLDHPPAKFGTYSAASAGVDSSSSEESAEGPMQAPEK